MCTSPIAIPGSPAASPYEVPQALVSAERAYQGSTIAAMLLLLSTLWLFR